MGDGNRDIATLLQLTRIPRPTRFTPTHFTFPRPSTLKHREYTFKGQVGKITSVPIDPDKEQYGVTFNDGRTSYFFNREHLQVDQDYNYEVIVKTAILDHQFIK